MKYNLFICFILLTVSLQLTKSDYIENVRKFTTGLLSSIVGNHIELDEKCLGEEYRTYLDKLIVAIRKENSILAFTLVWDIVKSIKANCPKNELTSIFNSVKDLIDSNKIVDEVVKNAREVMKILNELLDEKDPEKFGSIVGELIKIIVYQPIESHSLTFLGEDTNKDIELTFNMSKAEVDDFIDGFLEGISSVPYEENKCRYDIAGFTHEIIIVFVNVIDSFKTHKNVKESLIKVLELIVRLKPLEENCHLSSLSMNIAALSTKVGLAKLVYHLTKNYSKVYQYMEEINAEFGSKNWRGAGVSSGNLVKIGLNYSTK